MNAFLWHAAGDSAVGSMKTVYINLIIPVLRYDFHVLKIDQRITFHLCLLVYTWLNNHAPQCTLQHIKLHQVNLATTQILQDSPTVSSTHPHQCWRTRIPSRWTVSLELSSTFSSRREYRRNF